MDIRAWTTVAALTSVSITGCGAFSAADDGPPIIRVTYEGTWFGDLEIVTDGVRARTIYAFDPDAYSASDGTRTIMCQSGECQFGMAEPDAEPGTPEFEDGCPGATQTGTGEIAGRATTVWACEPSSIDSTTPRELEFDAEFPFVLMRWVSSVESDPPFEATSFEANVTVPEDYFSLAPPGFDIATITPEPVTAARAGEPGAVLAKVGGGELDLTEYTDGSAILVLGQVPQVQLALDRMQSVADGSLDRVVAVFNIDPSRGEEPPSEPLPVVAAYANDEEYDWGAMTAARNWPVLVLCHTDEGCAAIALADLGDEALAAEVARTR